MNTKIIRGLTIASFLIFLLPFAQYCEGMHKTEAEVPTADTTIVAMPYIEKVKAANDSTPLPPPPIADESAIETEQPTERESSAVFSFDNGENAYAYARVGIGFIIDFDKIDTLSDVATTIMSVCYLTIIVLSIFMLTQAFRSRYKGVKVLALFNIILLLFSTVAHYFTGELEHWSQIKYGYYLFILNMAAVAVLCSNVLVLNKSSTATP